MKLYAGSVECLPNQHYTLSYIQSTIKPNARPLIFTCPSQTTSSVIRLTPGTYTNAYAQLAEIEVFGIASIPATQITLRNARFANYDVSQPNGVGSIVNPWPGMDASLAIDGDLGKTGGDHTAHPKGGANSANFFVDFDSSNVAYVHIWPRMLNGYHDGYYEAMKLYAGSVECPADQQYTQSYVENTIKPNAEPMIFTCPSGTTASIIRLTRGTVTSGFVMLAEMEVFGNN